VISHYVECFFRRLLQLTFKVADNAEKHVFIVGHQLLVGYVGLHLIAVCFVTLFEYFGRKGQNIIDIDATIVCERDSHKGIIIGKGGAMLKKIGSNARYEIERLLDTKVNLKLWVKVKKDWRDSDFLIKNFGYNKDEI
jgi:hypothetical protein